MAKKLTPNNQPHLNKRVNGIYPTITIGPGPNVVNGLSVTIADEDTPRHYSHVVSTVPLGILRLMDTRSCGFSYALKEAIRILRYDASVKVAIKFTNRWWEKEPYNQKGGKSTTDRPSRVIVYPSNGIGGSEAVLLASYNWAQDALRFGTLVQGNKSGAEQILVDIILTDIADMFGIPFDTLKKDVVSHDAWDWYHQEHSCGKIALFFLSSYSHAE